MNTIPGLSIYVNTKKKRHKITLTTHNIFDAVGKTKRKGEQQFYMFTKTYVISPPREQWTGDDDTITTIKNILRKKDSPVRYSVVKNVLEKNVACDNQYNCERQKRNFKGSYAIPPGSFDEQFIADLIEEGFGLVTTTQQLNWLQVKQNCKHVGVSRVRNTYLRLSLSFVRD